MGSDDQIQRHHVKHTYIHEPADIPQKGQVPYADLADDVQHAGQTELGGSKHEAQLHDRVLGIDRLYSIKLHRIVADRRNDEQLQERKLLEHGEGAEPCTCHRTVYDRRGAEHIQEDVGIRTLLRPDVHHECDKQEDQAVSGISDDHREEDREEEQEP